MVDDVVRLSFVGQVLRKRWPLLICYAVVGVLAGMGASSLFSPGYETSVSVVVQGERTEDELVTEAVIATNQVVLDRAAEKLGWGVDGADLRGAVRANVVAGNVVEISGTARTPQRAQRLVNQMAKEYVAYSTHLISDPKASSTQVLEAERRALRKSIQETHQRIDELHEAATNAELSVDGVELRTELEGLRTALTAATEDLAEAEDVASAAHLTVMGSAPRPATPSPPTMLHLSAGGGILFALLGLVGHLMALRGDRRLESATEMGAALGVPLAGVAAVQPQRARRRLLRRKRAEAEATRPDSPEVRPYLRMLARLRQQADGDLRLLVLAARDDQLAHYAVARIVQAAGADLASLTTLRVARVSPTAPEIPEHEDVSEVLVVAGIGTRRAWELAGIADACGAAGYEIAGAVIARRARRRSSSPSEAELVVGLGQSADGTTLAATR